MGSIPIEGSTRIVITTFFSIGRIAFIGTDGQPYRAMSLFTKYDLQMVPKLAPIGAGRYAGYALECVPHFEKLDG